MLTVLLGLILFAAAGCQRAPAEPEATREPSPTVSVPTATSPPVRPQKAQPSDDTSPLPPPKSGEPGGSTSPLPAPTPTPGSPAEGAVPVPAEAAQAVQAAQADLAQRLGVEKGAIKVLSVEPVEWPDASLGCPQPGMVYAQVITPGFRVLLEAEGKTYAYHTDGGQNAVLCEKESTMDVPKAPSPIEPGLEHLVNLAKGDLAQRLSISVDQIEVLEAKSVVWPDASLGCPQPDMRYRQVPMDGSLIRLSVEGQVYAYHSGGGREPFLCEQTAKTSKGTPTPQQLIPPPGSESD
jgi:hypothetical protein